MRASFAAQALPQLSPGLREQAALQRLQLLKLWEPGDLPFKIVGVTSVAAPAVLLGAQSMPKHCLPLHITRVTKVQLYSASGRAMLSHPLFNTGLFPSAVTTVNGREGMFYGEP